MRAGGSLWVVYALTMPSNLARPILFVNRHREHDALAVNTSARGPGDCKETSET